MKLKYFLWFCLLLFCKSEAAEQQCVILLHGITRSHYSMSNLAAILAKHHYIVINKDYPSTSKSIKDIANENISPMIEECSKYRPNAINFVTHSMGGIILQVYLQNHSIANLGNIVMLSPPNHGSPIANLLHRLWLYRFVTGPAGQELTTDETSTPNQLHLNSRYQVGVITGTFSPFGSYFFGEANDGAVSVSSAKTNVMKDIFYLPVSHSFIMDDKVAQWQILNFLNNGKFRHLFFNCVRKKNPYCMNE